MSYTNSLVTCAFPYSNGSIHLGHLLEHIQADIWVRYKRMRGQKVIFICADDAHGTAIMIQSKKENITPEQLIHRTLIEHKNDFLNFNVIHDNYYSTHTTENLFFVKKIFSTLQKKNFLKKKNIYQYYDIKENIFLPDRFIKGTCPYCHTKQQYGDNCENCSSIYTATDLIDPKSILSNTKPLLKKTEHLFFDLPQLETFLKNWIYSGVLQSSVLNKIKEWFITGLKPWNISRDQPYFGFNIPNFPNKYFYVWMDAPIGYISTFKNFCHYNKDINFEDFWKIDSPHQLFHFIGKDIIYFHSLFWPAILEAADLRKPTGIFAHGYLTINQKKISKSKGPMILAKDWIKYLDSDSLRYYYASRLSSKVEDIEMNLETFHEKINADIVNKIVNLASRSAYFINVYFKGYLSKELTDIHLYKILISSSRKIESFFENRDFSLVVSEIIKMSNIANQYVNTEAPWNIFNLKNDISKNRVQNICSLSINLFKIIITCLKPIMPDLAQKSEEFLNISLKWEDIVHPLLNHKIALFKKLYSRINKNQVHFLLKTCTLK
ncbi:methionine--tRNA ligase [Buchnera aphidicola (Thelaxes californica)]|uniref:Methionine--tRNA ligase n=1 Tax=Buchnera aphidicola (Thelaxes californica) TaxID=1315998 RepID=A0A4D6Y9H1_9GAMM|nr:methionine--tRNA ligase [Buchnera aphidicola]QCI26646.1 methionine--tRNA ligase [Buchnera aphidicola (Thelaxes californica)]